MPSPAIYTRSLHDALPISTWGLCRSPKGSRRRRRRRFAATWVFSSCRDTTLACRPRDRNGSGGVPRGTRRRNQLKKTPPRSRPDRKSTRLNSSHLGISYAVTRDLHSFPTRRSSDLDLGIVSIAEGIETPQAAEICRDLGFQLMQGYYFGVPAKGSEWFRRRPKGDAAEKPAEEDAAAQPARSEEHTSELQSLRHLVCRHPRSTLVPYTTLFRSRLGDCVDRRRDRDAAGGGDLPRPGFSAHAGILLWRAGQGIGMVPAASQGGRGGETS